MNQQAHDNARMLALWPEPLKPEQIRLLRVSLYPVQTDAARALGVAAETVSRWEHGKLRMGWPLEFMLRVMVIAAGWPVVDSRDIGTLVGIGSRMAKTEET